MSDKISCIITDDEPFARRGLEGYVEKISFLELKGVCEDAFQLTDLLQKQPVDLLFLDIQMPQITGVEFLRAVRNPPKVILTTAYQQYAIEGFELDVIDYLLKPIPYERFLRAAWKAREYFSFKGANHTIPYLFLKANGKLEKVTFADILFIEGMENYVTVYMKDKKLVIHTTIKSLLEKLPEMQFLQVHRSYLVAINKIDTIEGNILHIKSYKVPISKYLREQVLGKIIK